jgi:hypothetical protein
MKIFIGLFASAMTFSAVADNQGIWTPNAKFQLENSDLRETMLFVSGMSYGLTEYSKELKGTAKVFCIPEKGLVQSSMIFDILNEHYAGKTITAEQATSIALAGLKERFPCR